MPDEIDMSYMTCQTSAAHTFGNVTAQVQKWLIDKFPPNTFKTVHVNSKLAHRQILSVPGDFIKKTKPMLVIRPRIEWGEKEVFLGRTMLTENMTEKYMTWGCGNLQSFIEDPKHNLRVKWLMNRNVMLFDVILIFSSFMEQANWMNYLQNAILVEHPFLLNTNLESYLAPEMMEVIGHCAGIPVHDKTGSVREFLDYMNSHSSYPITYKLKGSTNSDEFFRYYKASIDMLCSNFSADDGSKTNMISTAYQITFTMRAEFNSTGLYYVFSPKCKEHAINVPDGSTIIPMYTDVIVHEDYRLNEGWVMAARSAIKLDNGITDVINIAPILNTSVQRLISYHLENGIPLDNFIDIRVRKQGDLIRKGIDYDMDYKTLDLTFSRGSVFSTYTIIVYVDIKYMNELLKDIYNLD